MCRDAGREAIYFTPEARVFGPLGVPEILLIFIVALLLFGPRQMPKIGRSLGQALGEFRRASNDFKKTIEDEIAAEDLREVQKDLREIREAGNDLVQSAGAPPSKAPTAPRDPR